MAWRCRLRLNLVTKYHASGVICDLASFMSLDPCCFCIRIDLRHLAMRINFLSVTMVGFFFFFRAKGILLPCPSMRPSHLAPIVHSHQQPSTFRCPLFPQQISFNPTYYIHPRANNPFLTPSTYHTLQYKT
jgi:hypothetical protein